MGDDGAKGGGFSPVIPAKSGIHRVADAGGGMPDG